MCEASGEWSDEPLRLWTESRKLIAELKHFEMEDLGISPSSPASASADLQLLPKWGEGSKNKTLRRRIRLSRLFVVTPLLRTR
jgi:hypothetical protein